MQNQGRIFICLSTQESAAKNDRAEQSEHHLTLVALHNAAPCPDGRKTTRYQNNRIYRWKYYIQVISVWQGPVPATANFQIEVGGDEVGEDQGFGGDEEDHAPPVYAPPYLYPMLFKHSHLLAMSSTHISNSLSLQACSISICTTCQILSTFQSPTIIAIATSSAPRPRTRSCVTEPTRSTTSARARASGQMLGWGLIASSETTLRTFF